MERWLLIEVTGDGRGHLRADCRVLDDPGIGNQLIFTLQFDQTELPEILAGLDDVCEAFPVRGR